MKDIYVGSDFFYSSRQDSIKCTWIYIIVLEFCFVLFLRIILLQSLRLQIFQLLTHCFSLQHNLVITFRDFSVNTYELWAFQHPALLLGSSPPLLQWTQLPSLAVLFPCYTLESKPCNGQYCTSHSWTITPISNASWLSQDLTLMN